jgi:putative phosphotransacetylase
MRIHEKFIVERSANHIHLSEKDASTFLPTSKFLSDFKNLFKPLSIKGEFNTTIKVYSDQTKEKYSLVYPFREYSQIEVAMSDYYKIFKCYTTRVNSGELEGARTIKVHDMDIPIIVVKPHVHLHSWDQIHYFNALKFPFELSVKQNQTTDGINRIHLDTDQYAAIQ